MSLSIPSVLEAAVDTAPETQVDVAGTRMTVAHLAQRVDSVARLLADGDEGRTGVMALPALDDEDGLVHALAAAKLGILLTDDLAGTEVPGPSTDHPWTRTPLVRLGDHRYVHGDFVERGGREVAPVPEAVTPIARLVGAITGVSTSSVHDAI